MNLSELIDTHRGGRSYADVARDCGGSPSAERIRQLLNGPLKNFPDPPTVAGLARGLKVSQASVVLAAAESLGLDVSTSMPRVVELLPAGARKLTEQQAAAVAHLVRTIVEEREPEESDGDDRNAAPMNVGPESTIEEVYRAWLEQAVGRQYDGDPLTPEEEEKFALATQWFEANRPDYIFHAEGSGLTFTLVQLKDYRDKDEPGIQQIAARKPVRRD